MNIKFSLGNGQIGEGTLPDNIQLFRTVGDNFDNGQVEVTLTKEWDDFPIGTEMTINFTDILPSPVEYSEDVEINEELEIDMIVKEIPVKSQESDDRYNDKWNFLESIKQSIGTLKPSFCFE